ncbi:MAG: hypothetical protein UR26_C0002G0007 [candidate division TM6 bacterium GW2011_GWF2_32_72]|nr:MAG: hypothetical protein UR26_C0002G0007 [candidate division TM6 bacterium GW2011_GWF2_32_72]
MNKKTLILLLISAAKLAVGSSENHTDWAKNKAFENYKSAFQKTFKNVYTTGIPASLDASLYIPFNCDFLKGTICGSMLALKFKNNERVTTEINKGYEYGFGYAFTQKEIIHPRNADAKYFKWFRYGCDDGYDLKHANKPVQSFCMSPNFTLN